MGFFSCCCRYHSSKKKKNLKNNYLFFCVSLASCSFGYEKWSRKINRFVVVVFVLKTDFFVAFFLTLVLKKLHWRERERESFIKFSFRGLQLNFMSSFTWGFCSWAMSCGGNRIIWRRGSRDKSNNKPKRETFSKPAFPRMEKHHNPLLNPAYTHSRNDNFFFFSLHSQHLWIFLSWQRFLGITGIISLSLVSSVFFSQHCPF